MISLGGYMDNIKVVVSPVIKQDGRQKIFISFIDEEDKREAEAIIPGLVFIKNVGFSDEELDEFREFLENEQGNILETAKTINPLAEFFGKKK
jgi:hypothetical protein